MNSDLWFTFIYFFILKESKNKDFNAWSVIKIMSVKDYLICNFIIIPALSYCEENLNKKVWINFRTLFYF